MVLNNYRARGEAVLAPLAKRLSGVSPSALTITGLALAVVAAYFYYASSVTASYYLLLAALFVFLSSLFDALDGTVARLNNIASKRGDFLDHAVDRYEDVVLLVAIAFSPWCSSEVGIFALLGVLLTSYMGTQAQAVGLKRHYGGLLGRVERLLLMMIIPLLQYVIVYFGVAMPYEISLIEWMMIYFAIAGNVTAIQRAVDIWSKLKTQNS